MIGISGASHSGSDVHIPSYFVTVGVRNLEGHGPGAGTAGDHCAQSAQQLCATGTTPVRSRTLFPGQTLINRLITK